MAIQAQLADGRVLEFPDGTDPTVIQATVKRVIGGGTSIAPSEMTLEELEGAPSAPFSLSDLAKSAQTGLYGGVKSLADVFGAGSGLSKTLGQKIENVQAGLTPERKAEIARQQELEKRASESGDIGRELSTFLGGVAAAPLQSTAQAVGTSAPSILAGIAAIPLGAPGSLAAGVGVISRFALGAAQGVGEYKGSVFDAVKDEYMKRGLSEQEAEERAIKAQEYSMDKAAQIGGSALLGALDAFTGIEKGPGQAIRKVGAGKLTEEALQAGIKELPEQALKAPSLAGSALRSMAGESPLEGLQGGFGQYAQNLALQQEGLLEGPTTQGVLGAAIRDAAVGALAGGAFTPFEMSSRRSDYELDRRLREVRAERAFEEERKGALERAEQSAAQEGTINLPSGYAITSRFIDEGVAPETFGIFAEGSDKPLTTSSTQEEADAKIESLSGIRKQEQERLLSEADKMKERLDADRKKIETLEATGRADSPEYQSMVEAYGALEQDYSAKLKDIYNQIESYSAPLSVAPIGQRKVINTEFDLTKDGQSLGMFKTLDEAQRAADEHAGPEAVAAAQEAGRQAEVVQRMEALKQDLTSRLRKFGLEDVGLNVVEKLEKGAGGRYIDKLIEVAMTEDKPIQTMRHEALHALKDLGFFTDQQWNALKERAKKEWVGKYLEGQQTVLGGKTMSRLEGYRALKLTEDEILEEAIADAFGDYDKGELPPPGLIASLFKRLKAFFQNFGQALRGAGFESAEDIFQRVERGELKGRKPAEKPAEKSAEAAEEKLSIPGKKPESDIGHKREATSGRYVGAPDWVGSSPQRLAALRKTLLRLTMEGAAGRYWYENSSRAILQLAGNDKKEAEKIVGLIAIFSPNATVPANTSMALNAYYQFKTGQPIKAGTGMNNQKAEDLLSKDEGWSGIKTNSFYQNLMVEIDPSKLDEGVATMDMWMALAFDYGMKHLDQGPKYKFAEREIQRIAKNLGWKAHQVQAAIWVAMKGRIDPIRGKLQELELKNGIGEMYEKDGKTLFRVKPERRYDHYRLAHKLGMEYPLSKQDIESSKYDFSDALGERTAQISWEATPGATSKILPGLLKAPIDQKFEYLRAIHGVLAEKNGADKIAKKIGLPSGNTVLGFSAWQGDVGAGAQTFTASAVAGSSEKRNVTKEARDLLNLYCAIKGFVLGQEAVVWHMPIYDGSIKNQNGFEVTLNRPIREDEMKELYESLHETFGTWDIAPGYTPTGVRMLNFVETSGDDGAQTIANIPFKGRVNLVVRDGDWNETPVKNFITVGKGIRTVQKVPAGSRLVAKLDNKSFHDGVRKAMGNLPSDFGDGIVELKQYRSVGDYISNDWTEAPQGEQYEAKIASAQASLGGEGRSDLQEWVANLHADVEAVNKRFSEKYGWGSPTVPEGKAAKLSLPGVTHFDTADEAFAATRHLEPPKTEGFKRFIQGTEFVDEKGDPKVMYHGTARQFYEFMPAGDAEAIYLSANPYDAENFAGADEERLRRQVYRALNRDEKFELFQRAVDKAVKGGEMTAEEGEAFLSKRKNVPDYGRFGSGAVEKNILEELLALSPTKASVIPLWVSAKNVFDFENPEHVKRVLRYVENEVELHMENPDKWLTGKKGQMVQGTFQAVTDPRIQKAIRALGFDGFTVREKRNGPKNYAVYGSQQVKSATGNVGDYSLEKKDIRYSLPYSFKSAKEAEDAAYEKAPPTTKEFKQFFGASKIVEEGRPQVMYHGSDNLFTQFQDNKPIFVTPDPYFADDFATDRAKDNGSDPMNIKVYPLWVRAEMPFDYENGNHVSMVIGKIVQDQKLKSEDSIVRLRKSTPNIKLLYKEVQKGLWSVIEDPVFQQAIKDLGFDSFNVYEGGAKNLAVYSAAQVKSATANTGDYSLDSKDIRFSLARFNKADLPQDDRDYVLPENTLIYHGAYKERADRIEETGGVLLSRPPMKVSGGMSNEGGLIFFGGQETAQRYADSKADPMAVKFAEEAGIERLPGKVFETATDRPYKLINRFYKINADEAKRLTEALGLPDYKKLSAGTPLEMVASRAHDSGEVERYKVKTYSNRDQMVSAPWPVIFETLGVDGFFDGFAVALTANNGIRLIGKDGKLEKFSLPNLSSGAQNAILSKTAKRQQDGFAARILGTITPESWSGLRQAALNRYNRLGEADKALAAKMGGVGLMADQSAEAAALMSDHVAGVLASVMGVNGRKGGVPIFRNGLTTVDQSQPGLMEILAPLARYGDPEIYRRFQFYAAVKRGGRLFAEGRERLIEPVDIAFAQELLQKHPEFESIRKNYVKFNDAVVKYMVDTGVLSKRDAATYTMYADYIPFYRQHDGQQTLGPKIFQSISGVKKPKQLKGGEAPLDDFLETLVRNTQSAISSGMKNHAAQMAIKVGSQVGIVHTITPGSTVSDIEKIKVLENGVPMEYQVSDQLFIDAVKSLNMPDLPFLGILSVPSNVLRNFVTRDPGFMMANLLRDSLSAYVTSGQNYTPVIGTVQNFAKALGGKSKAFDALLNAGVIGGYEFSANIEQSGRVLEKQLAKRAGKTPVALKPFQSLWDGLERGTTASDAATRMAIYDRVMAETGNEFEAIFRATEVMNFNRRGSSAVVRILTAAVPFLNARFQGLDVFYRASTGNMNTNDAKEIQRKFWVRAMTMFGLSMLYYFAVADSDEYKQQEQETKDNNWIVPAFGIRIPIPFEVGTLFKTIPERIAAFAFGQDTGADFVAAMNRAANSSLPISPTAYIPQTIKPVLEALTNYNFFTQREIVGQGMQGVSPEYQVGPGTSALAEFIGKHLGLSPLKVDNVIKGYTGTMGMYAVDLIDSVLNTSSDSPKASKRFEQMPVIKRFALDPEARGSVTNYYQLKDSVDTAVRTMNLLERSMKPEEFTEYVQNNIGILSVKDYVSDLEKSMKEIREMRKAVSSSSMSGDEKRSALDALSSAEINLTKNIQTVKLAISKI